MVRLGSLVVTVVFLCCTACQGQSRTSEASASSSLDSAADGPPVVPSVRRCSNSRCDAGLECVANTHGIENCLFPCSAAGDCPAGLVCNCGTYDDAGRCSYWTDRVPPRYCTQALVPYN